MADETVPVIDHSPTVPGQPQAAAPMKTSKPLLIGACVVVGVIGIANVGNLASGHAKNQPVKSSLPSKPVVSDSNQVNSFQVMQARQAQHDQAELLRQQLRPLHSLWIDLLVMRLMNEPAPDQKPVWFVLDELASLQRLPQLHTALTEARKSKNPMVLGFQGRAQLQAIYGDKLAEVMVSQPATKLFMKTADRPRLTTSWTTLLRPRATTSRARK